MSDFVDKVTTKQSYNQRINHQKKIINNDKRSKEDQNTDNCFGNKNQGDETQKPILLYRMFKTIHHPNKPLCKKLNTSKKKKKTHDKKNYRQNKRDKSDKQNPWREKISKGR